MGKNTKIICTVVPKRCVKVGSEYELYVNVFLTPRLPDTGWLKDYYEILHWYEYENLFRQVSKIQFAVTKFKKDGTNKWNLNGTPIELNRVRLIERPTLRYHINNEAFFDEPVPQGYPLPANEKPGESFWKRMFHGDTPVSGWIISDLAYEFISKKLNTGDLKRRMQEAIMNTINQLSANDSFEATQPSTVPGRHSEEDQNRIASFIIYLEQLKEKEPADILADPVLGNTFNEFTRPLIHNLYQQLKQFDTSWRNQNKKLTQLLTMNEVEKRNLGQTEEFHKRLSAFAQYPQLLQITGWLWEYCITIDQKTYVDIELTRENTDSLSFIHINDKHGFCAAGEALAGNGTPNLFDLFIRKVQFHYPLTAYRLFTRKNTFRYIFTRGADPRLVNKYFETDDENIRIKKTGKSGYEIEPELIDKVQLFENIGDLLRRLEKTGKDGPSVQKRDEQLVLEQEQQFLQAEQARTGGKPDYVSNGLSINISKIEAIVETSTQNQPADPDRAKDFNTQKAGSILDISSIVFSHNLDAGYRIDIVSIDEKGKIRAGSLCARFETYVLTVDKNNFLQRDKKLSVTLAATEGCVMESAQLSKDQSLMVDQELFRYNNWSLVSPQPGEHNKEDEELAAGAMKYHEFDTDIMPLPGSLVPLRFGNWYSFQLRLADICGNGTNPQTYAQAESFFASIRFDHNSTAKSIPVNDEYWTSLVKYYRMDPIQAPIIIPGQQLFRSMTLTDEEGKRRKQVDWVKDRWGEDVQVMVIRSTANGGALNCEQEAIRYLGPPKTNLHFVIKHGVIDNLLAAYSQDEALRNELLELGDTEIFGSDQTFYLPQQKDLDYLFDPVVNGYEIIIGHKQKLVLLTSGNILAIDNRNPKYYAEKQYRSINLTELSTRSGERFQYSQASITSPVIIKLKPGVEEFIDVNCTHFDQITNAIGTTVNQYTIDNLYHGCVDRLKRTRIVLIHAVQKPCITGPLQSGEVNFKLEYPVNKTTVVREAGKTSVELTLQFNLFPVFTAETFILHVEYFDWLPNRGNNQGYEPVLVQRVVKTGIMPDQLQERDVVFSALQHLFQDTKHKRANYRLEAVSKFKKYFNPEITDFSVYGNYSLWNQFKPTQAHEVCNKWLSVPSSVRPDAPKVEKIVPLLSWDKTTNGIKRTCNKVRIYFNHDWYSSGEGEQLAVFLMETTHDAGSAHVPLPLENVISQFGLDPGARPYNLNDANDRMKPLELKHFILPAKNACGDCPNVEKDIMISSLDFDKPGETGAWFNERVHAALYCIRYMPSASNPDTCIEAARKSGAKETVVIEGFEYGILKDKETVQSFEPTDAHLGRFYVDVTLDNTDIPLDDYYLPLLRLAIARFQPQTVRTNDSKDLRFSKVVLTDFVPLLPTREVTLEKTAKGCSIKYKGKAVRKDSAENATNKVYVFKDSVQNQLAPLEARENPSDEAVCTGGNAAIELSCSNLGSNQRVVIEEYEQYANPNAPTGEKHPQKNFSQRLVFSYSIFQNELR